MKSVLGRKASSRAGVSAVAAGGRRRTLRDLASVAGVVLVVAVAIAAIVGPASTNLQPILDPARPALDRGPAEAAPRPLAVDIRRRPPAAASHAPSVLDLAGSVDLDGGRAELRARSHGPRVAGPTFGAIFAGGPGESVTAALAESVAAAEPADALDGAVTVASTSEPVPVSHVSARASGRASVRTTEVVRHSRTEVVRHSPTEGGAGQRRAVAGGAPAASGADVADDRRAGGRSNGPK